MLLKCVSIMKLIDQNGFILWYKLKIQRNFAIKTGQSVLYSETGFTLYIETTCWGLKLDGFQRGTCLNCKWSLIAELTVHGFLHDH